MRRVVALIAALIVAATLGLAGPAAAGTYISDPGTCAVNNHLDYSIRGIYDKGSQNAKVTQVDWHIKGGVGIRPPSPWSISIMQYVSDSGYWNFGGPYPTGSIYTGFTHYDTRSVKVRIGLFDKDGGILCYGNVYSK